MSLQGITLQYGNISSRSAWTLVAPSTNGLPTVSTAQVKWGTTSAFWDGTAKGIAFTGSSLATAAVNAGGLIPTGTGMSFTLEMWIYIPTANLGTQRTFFDAGQGGIAIGMLSNSRLFMGQAGVTFGVQTSTTIAGNTWTHIAFMISGSTNYIFINGVATSGSTYNYSFTNPFGGVIQPAVGIDGFGTRYVGYMQDIRISNGAIYPTTGFSPPTAPLTNTAQTVLLIPCYDGTIADQPSAATGGITLQYGDISVATRTAITTASVNNAQVSTAQSVFGNASALFSSVNSAITATNASSALTFGTGDFTYELRYRAISKASSFPPIILAPYQGNFVGGAYNLMDRHDAANTKITFWVGNFSTGAPMLTSTTSVSNNTWYAVAITRSGNTFRMFIDGVLEATATFSGSLDNNTMSVVGYGSSGTGSNAYINGYMDEIRVSNIARYTATYTPATQPFTNDANTRLLLHCDGTNGSTSFPDDNLGTTAGGLTITY